MKRYIPYLVIIFAFLVNFSCGQGAALKEENAKLTSELAKIKHENEALREKNLSLEKQVKELSETPVAMYERAQNLKTIGQYEEAIQILDQLIIKASGQPIAQNAQREIATLQKLKSQKEKEEERAKRDAFKDIGGGFGVRRITIKSSFGTTEVLGEIKNNSGRSYSLVNIIVALYDANDNLLDNAVANISNFPAGSVKSFSAYASVSSDRIEKYRVQFENAL